MPKKFFLLFSELGKLPPKIYKTISSVQKHLKENKQYSYLQYDTQSQSNTAYEIKKILHKQYKLQSKLPSLQQSVNSGYKQNSSSSDNSKVPQRLDDQKFSKSKLIHRSIQQLNQEREKLLNLTPDMPSFMHYHFPTQATEPINTEKEYYGYFDGCTKYNPGPSGVGYYLKTDNKMILQASWPLGTRTNNQAEFTALLYLLVDSYINGIQKLRIFGDSKLAICISAGEMTANSVNIINYAEATKRMLELFDKKNVKLSHISRIYNVHADKLSNSGLKKTFLRSPEHKVL